MPSDQSRKDWIARFNSRVLFFSFLEKRREMLISAIESFLKKSTMNLKSLQFEFPLFLSPAMNNFITTYTSQNMFGMPYFQYPACFWFIASTDKVLSFFLESFCSTVQSFDSQPAPNDTMMIIQTHRYTSMSAFIFLHPCLISFQLILLISDDVVPTKKLIPRPEAGSFVLVQDILIKYFHFEQSVLESSCMLVLLTYFSQANW